MYQVAQNQPKNTQIQLSGAKSKLTEMFKTAGIEAILPSHISMDSFVQVAAIAYMKEPKLAQATQNSLMMAFSECAKDGLIPNGKEAFINSYKKNFGDRQNPNYMMVAEYQPMIEGVLKRARNSGDVEFIDVGVVFPEEVFEHWVSVEGKHFKHVPDYTIDRSVGRISLFYGVAKLKSGEVKVEVMSRADVDNVRSASLSKNSPAWNNWYDRMGLKAVGHRLCRQLPKGSELVEMLEKGDEKDFNQEIEINPMKGTVNHGNNQQPQIESLMGDTGYQETYHEPVVESQPQTDVGSLMGGDFQDAGQSTIDQEQGVYNALEDLIMGIGSTGNRAETIEEYKYAVGEVKDATGKQQITPEQADTLNAQLTSVHQAITGGNH